MTTLISSHLDLGQRSILLQYVDAIRLNATSTEAVGLAYGLAGISIALMETATLLGDKELENEAISLLKSCLINHQLPLLVVGGGFIGADAPFNPDREHIYMLKCDHEAISEAIREYQIFLILR